MKRLFDSIAGLYLTNSVMCQKLVNTGASFEERFGSTSFADNAIPQEQCNGNEIPNCLFSMDIQQILISFNRDEETLKGFKTTFVEQEDETIV